MTTAKAPPRASPAPQTVGDVLDQLNADHVIELADRASSLWRSVAEAAWRGDLGVIRLRCQQISAITKEAFRTVKELGASSDEGVER